MNTGLFFAGFSVSSLSSFACAPCLYNSHLHHRIRCSLFTLSGHMREPPDRKEWGYRRDTKRLGQAVELAV